MRDTSSDLAKTALGTVRGEAEASEVPLHMPPCDVATTSPHGSLAAVNCLLSDEIILRIWQYLGATELARLQCVCRRFNSLAADPQIWKALYLQAFVGDWVRLQQQLDPMLPPTSGKGDSQRFQLSLRKQGCSSRAYWGLPEQYHVRDTRTAADEESSYRGKQQGRDRPGWGNQDSLGDGPRNDGLDWQALFRVSSNWQKGRFAFSELASPTEQDLSPSGSERSTRAELSPRRTLCSDSASQVTAGGKFDSSTSFADRDQPDRTGATTLIASAGNLVFTSLRTTRDDRGHAGHDDPSHFRQVTIQAPCVKVYCVSVPSATLAARAATAPRGLDPAVPLLELRSENLRAAVASRKVGMPTITDVKADTASSSAFVRLLVAYSSGDWSVFRLTTDPRTVLTASEEIFWTRSSPASAQRAQGSVMSAFHYPILATCTEDFDITIFRLIDSSTTASADPKMSAMLLRRMKGSSCHWPASMSLASIAVSPSDPVPSDQQAYSRKRKRVLSPTCPDPYTDPAPGTSRSFAGIKEARKRRRQCEVQTPSLSRMPLDACVVSLEPHQAFRLDIAYSTPCYPGNWSIALQEIIIVLNGTERVGDALITSRYATARPRLTGQRLRSDASEDEGQGRRAEQNDQEVSSTSSQRPQTTLRRANTQRSIFASQPSGCDPPSGNRLRSEGSRVTSITNDESTLVAGSEDNLLDVYKISGSTNRAFLQHAAGVSAAPCHDLTLEHHQVLHGHGASVSTVALSGNRVVSGSTDGNIMVWTLEQSSGLVSTVGSLRHAITLRTPPPVSTPLHSIYDSALPRTLYRLLVQARARQCQVMPPGTERRMQRTSLDAPSQIKRVSTTFDRILSVTGDGPLDHTARTKDRSRCNLQESDTVGAQVDYRHREKIQVWSFAG